MTEALFILTIVFVAYVVYTMVDEQKATTKSTTLEAKPETDIKPEIDVALQPQSPVVVDPIPSNNTLTTEIKVSRTRKKNNVSPAPTAAKHQVKNPKTGEITTTSSNYRFAKRWLKEALVTEKLLDKIYKNDELNEDIETKIKNALTTLETIKKYKV